jgi:Phosphodiester glycosidase
MNSRLKPQLKSWGLNLLGLSLLAAPIGLYAQALSQRPIAASQPATPLFSGVTIERRHRARPYPQQLTILAIDLAAPGLRPWTNGDATTAQTTTRILRQQGLQVAINAGFFSPFYEETPWNYAPRSGQPVTIVGRSIRDGQTYSRFPESFPVLCFYPQVAYDQGAPRLAQIVQGKDACPGAKAAIAGNRFLLRDGEAYKNGDAEGKRPYPRTAVAIDRSGRKLWLLIADGKQPGYSHGASLPELTALAQELGATDAINLDGGGSTTLVAEVKGQPQVLNAPIHGKWPMMERSVATVLGFYAGQLK